MDDIEYYEILELNKNATKAQIAKNFRKLSLKYHPDRNSTEEGQEMMKKITEAYSVLKDDQKRRDYDMFGKEGAPKFPGFNDFPTGQFPFNQFPFSNFRNQPQKEPPTVESVKVTLEEMYMGSKIERNVEVTHFCLKCKKTGFEDCIVKICKHCNGIKRKNSYGKLIICKQCYSTGKSHEPQDKHCTACKSLGTVNILHTIDIQLKKNHIDDEYITFTKMGDQTEKGFKDLIVNLNIVPHEHYELEDNNLILNVKLNFAESICGFSKKYPFLDGTDIVIEYDKPIKNKDIKQIYGKGWFGHSLYVVFTVEEPNLLKKHKDAICMALTGKKYTAKMTGKNILRDYASQKYGREKVLDDDEDDDVQCRQS